MSLSPGKAFLIAELVPSWTRLPACHSGGGHCRPEKGQMEAGQPLGKRCLLDRGARKVPGSLRFEQGEKRKEALIPCLTQQNVSSSLFPNWSPFSSPHTIPKLCSCFILSQASSKSCLHSLPKLARPDCLCLALQSSCTKSVPGVSSCYSRCLLSPHPP